MRHKRGPAQALPVRCATVLLLAAGWTGLAFANGKPEKPTADRAPKITVPAVRPKAADICLQTLGGKTVILAGAFQHKPTILVLWASWYPDCRRESPMAKAAFARFSKEGLDVVVVDREGRGKVVSGNAYVHAHGLTYPVYYDADLASGKAYGVNWILTILHTDPRARSSPRPPRR